MLRSRPAGPQGLGPWVNGGGQNRGQVKSMCFGPDIPGRRGSGLGWTGKGRTEGRVKAPLKKVAMTASFLLYVVAFQSWVGGAAILHDP